MRLVCVGDPAGKHDRLSVPAGDLLVVTGSLTSTGYTAEVDAFAAWLRKLPHPHKIVVPGDRDHAISADPDRARSLLAPASLLCDEELRIASVLVCGIPHRLHRGPEDLGAFAVAERAARTRWGLVAPCDVLVSSAPPLGFLDDSREGCPVAAWALGRIRPRLHVFGGGAPRAWFVDGRVSVRAGSADPVVLGLRSSGQGPEEPLET